MISKRITMVIISILLIAGCQTTINIGPSTVLIEASEVPKPKWIYDIGLLSEKKKDYEYFYGVSKRCALERDARNDAYVNAVKQIIQFVGIRMEIEWEQIQKIRQRGSEIINPEIAIWESESLIAKALVRGSKGVRWYWEKYNNYISDKFYDSFYTAYVVVSISQKNLMEAKRKLEEPVKIRRDKIQELDEVIKKLLIDAEGEKNKYLKVEYLKQAKEKYNLRQDCNDKLRDVDPSGIGLPPPIHIVEIERRLKDILLKDFLIGISVKGSRAGEIQEALIQGLNQQGFSISENLGKANVLVKGIVEIEPFGRGTPEWKNVQWRAYFEMVDKKDESVFGSVSKKGREGHLSLQQAENSAVEKIRKALTTEISDEMGRYIFSR